MSADQEIGTSENRDIGESKIVTTDEAAGRGFSTCIEINEDSGNRNRNGKPKSEIVERKQEHV